MCEFLAINIAIALGESDIEKYPIKRIEEINADYMRGSHKAIIFGPAKLVPMRETITPEKAIVFVPHREKLVVDSDIPFEQHLQMFINGERS